MVVLSLLAVGVLTGETSSDDEADGLAEDDPEWWLTSTFRGLPMPLTPPVVGPIETKHYILVLFLVSNTRHTAQRAELLYRIHWCLVLFLV